MELVAHNNMKAVCFVTIQHFSLRTMSLRQEEQCDERYTHSTHRQLSLCD